MFSTRPEIFNIVLYMHYSFHTKKNMAQYFLIKEASFYTFYMSFNVLHANEKAFHFFNMLPEIEVVIF